MSGFVVYSTVMLWGLWWIVVVFTPSGQAAESENCCSAVLHL